MLGGIFRFYLNFINILQANSGDPDQTLCPAASDLVLHCLPMSHKKDARLIWVKQNFESKNVINFCLAISLSISFGCLKELSH